MKKTLIPLLIASSFMLFSCKNKEEEEKIEVHVLDKVSVLEGSLNKTSYLFSSFDLSFNSSTLTDLFTNFLTAIDNQNLEEVSKYRNQINKESNSLVDKLSVAEAKYSANPTQSTYNTYYKLYGYYDSYAALEESARNLALSTNNQEIIKVVFNNEKAISCSDIDRAYELLEVMSNANYTAEEMRASTSKYTLEAYLKEGLSLFKDEYAPACNELASLYSYNSYQDYAYESTYFRKYKSNQASSLVSLIKEKIVPLYKEMDYSKYSEEAQAFIKLAEKECFALSSLNLGVQMDEYASKMGKVYADNYTHLFSDGYYIFSNKENSNNVAVTYPLKSVNDGLCYFGNKYQAVNDLTHEFGHFLANSINKESANKSFDINETFSQGNEMLFASFLMNNYQSESLKGVGESLLKNLELMLLGYSYAVEVENYLFDNYKTKTIDELYSGMSSIYDSYGTSKLRKDYWFGPVLINTCYYSSYLTSAVESLELFSMAQSDFKAAKNTYISLISQVENLDEVEAWKKAGLPSPFEASMIENIAKIFNK